MNYRYDKYKQPISILGFGCMRFPRTASKINFAETEREILAAIEAGVNYFDTAYVYPGSEATLGEILAKHKLREKVNIATKLPHYLIKSGEIRQIGFSYHGNSDMFCKLIDAYDWDFCQIQYNYMDEHTQAGRRGLQYANKKGIPVVIMEPLRGGKLVNRLPDEAIRIFEQHRNSVYCQRRRAW